MTALSDLLNSLNREKWSSREIENRADKAGQKVSYAAVSRYLNGNHPAKPSAQVLEAFAAVFGTDVNRLRAAAGQGPVSDRFELPPEADMLDPDERRAVVNLVRVMARRKAEDDATQASEDQAGTHPDVQSTRDRTPMSDSAVSVPDDPMVDYEITKGRSTEGGLDALNREREERGARDAHP